MSVLSGRRIKELNIISPYQDRETVLLDNFTLTYGQSCVGYDIRVEFDPYGHQVEKVLNPYEFCLASSIEHFTMPNAVMGIVHDKSTWVRRGLTVQNTVLEPGWNGFLTLELINHSKESIILRKGYPIAQVVFHDTDPDTLVYSGKYQQQKRGPQEAK